MAQNQPESRRVEPWIGAKALGVLKREERALSPSLERTLPTVPETGYGSVLKDVDGKEHVDLDAGMGSLLLGYCPSPLVEAITGQLARLHACATSTLSSEATVRLGELLQSILPSRERSKVLLETSGAHALEAALKLARWHTRNGGLITLAGSLHGETYGALSVSSAGPGARRYFEPFLPGVVFAPFPYCYRCPFRQSHPRCNYACTQYLEDYILNGELPHEDTAAIIFEAVQVRSCIVPPSDYFQKLRRLADAYSILLIDNEVWTAPGRTGSWSALEHWNTRPDILCAGEALAGGLPIGAVVADTEVMDWDPGSHTGLLGASLLSCVASLKLLEVVKERRLVSEATNKGRHVQKRLEELQGKSALVGDVRGKGLLVGFEIVRNQRERTPGRVEAQEILRRCWRRGVILGYDGLCTLRISPALTIEIDLLEKTMDTVELVVTDVSREAGSC